MLDGDVKVQDRVALMFRYASVGVGIGVGAAMVTSFFNRVAL